MEVEVMSAMSKEYFSPARRLAWAISSGLILGGLFLLSLFLLPAMPRPPAKI